MVAEDETLEVASVGGRAPRVLSRHILCRDIIQPRIEEIFSFVKAEIVRLGCEDMLASGAVLTGGTTQLPGMTELAEEILGHPGAARGVPKGVGGLAEVVHNATFSTAVGLVQYGVARQSAARVTDAPQRARPLLAPAPHALDRVLARDAGAAQRPEVAPQPLRASRRRRSGHPPTDGERARQKAGKKLASSAQGMGSIFYA